MFFNGPLNAKIIELNGGFSNKPDLIAFTGILSAHKYMLDRPANKLENSLEN